MAQAALDITGTAVELREVTGTLCGEESIRDLVAPSRSVLVLGAVLIILQIMDGVLTGIGINNFGTAAEGNALLRFLMEEWGCFAALLTVKTFAIGVVCALCLLSQSVSWIKQAMVVIIGIYLTAAVVPWTAILLSGNI